MVKVGSGVRVSVFRSVHLWFEIATNALGKGKFMLSNQFAHIGVLRERGVVGLESCQQ